MAHYSAGVARAARPRPRAAASEPAVITPRQTRLFRAPDLRTFQRVIAELALEGPPAARRARAVMVSSHAAADTLRRTLEHHWLAQAAAGGPAACVMPDLVTRAEWYRRLAEHRLAADGLLTDLDREVVFGRAARAAEADGCRAPFALRPGLFAALLAFYDELKRRGRTVDAFERLLISSLEPAADADRGAARLLEETRFLGAVFRRYEAALEAAGLCDEHRLRARVLAESQPSPYRHVVVTVADEVIESAGLWPADFDLLSRLPDLERLDLVATEEVLAAGFHERVHQRLPGVEEVRVQADGAAEPILVAPSRLDGPRYAVYRDREDELMGAVRRAKQVARAAGPDALARVAVVFERPLPYVYLARQVCRSAGLPFQTFEALPLAAEPYAAALDLVFALVLEGYTRPAIVALLKAPWFRFTHGGRHVTPAETAALDQVLAELRFLGGREAFARLVAGLEGGGAGDVPRELVAPAVRAARAFLDAVEGLAALDAPAPPSRHLATLRAFLDRYERPVTSAAAWGERYARGRAAILGALEALAAAHRRHDDAPQPFSTVAATLRRWIEDQTFAPRTGQAGLHLIDAAAARYGEFDEVTLVGLVDTDWPPAPPRTIFYPANLLVQLGWPPDAERRRGPRAAFRDLLRLPGARVSVSSFALEHDALMRPSPLLEELEAVDLAVVRQAEPAGRIFAHEALLLDPIATEAVSGPAASWLRLRQDRSPADAPIFDGRTGPRGPEAYRVSAVERYLHCPFQYFAAHVLRLGEERDDEPGLTPQERGRLLHEVLRAFFDAWQASGRGAITPENFADAAAEFARVADAHLDRVPDAERLLERARWLGSAGAAGVAARVLEAELEWPAPVVERLLEYALEGEFAFPAAGGRRVVRLRGKADRVDLLADGTLRIVDYKLRRAPDRQVAIQLPVYGVAAEQHLRAARGRSWRFAGAAYVACGATRAFTPLAPPGATFDEAVAEGLARFLEAVDGIAGGEFPVRPRDPFRCRVCPYPSVCRKDDVRDE